MTPPVQAGKRGLAELEPGASAHLHIAAGLYSYAGAGTGCALSKDTKYFVVMSTGDTGGDNFYRLAVTNSGAETAHPSGNGWSIANALRSKWGSNAWANLSSSPTGLLHIAADD